mgnify:CR=1 FL=1
MSFKNLTRKRLITALVTFAISSWAGTLSAFEDGLYSFKDFPNQYAVLLSEGDLYQGFIFSVDPDDGDWSQVRGSKIDASTVRISDIGRSKPRIKVFEATQGLNGVEARQVSCIDYPEGSGQCDEVFNESIPFQMVMPANGRFKAIFETQWGAKIAMFESNGVVAALFFEFGYSLADNSIVSAYTAKMGSDLLISDIVEVVAPANGDDEVTFDMVWQISDLDNPQLELILSNCSSNDEAIDCSEFDPFFSYVVKVF